MTHSPILSIKAHLTLRPSYLPKGGRRYQKATIGHCAMFFFGSTSLSPRILSLSLFLASNVNQLLPFLPLHKIVFATMYPLMHYTHAYTPSTYPFPQNPCSRCKMLSLSLSLSYVLMMYILTNGIHDD